jgi:hypothetical protein
LVSELFYSRKGFTGLLFIQAVKVVVWAKKYEAESQHYVPAFEKEE